MRLPSTSRVGVVTDGTRLMRLACTTPAWDDLVELTWMGSGPSGPGSTGGAASSLLKEAHMRTTLKEDTS